MGGFDIEEVWSSDLARARFKRPSSDWLLTMGREVPVDGVIVSLLTDWEIGGVRVFVMLILGFDVDSISFVPEGDVEAVLEFSAVFVFIVLEEPDPDSFSSRR